MNNIQKRIKQMLGLDIGYSKNLLSGGDVLYTELVKHWSEAAGKLFQGTFLVGPDATGSGADPLGLVAASAHNPLALEIANVHTEDAAAYSLVFTTTFTKLTFDINRLYVKVSKHTVGGADFISDVAKVTAVDNTAAGTTVGFTVGISSATANPITENDKFHLEIWQI